MSSYFGLERHAVERTLLLIPILYGAYVFGFKGGIVSLIISVFIMVPRVIFISSHRKDSLFETILTITIGFLINWLLESRRIEINLREQTLIKLEKSRKELQRIGKRFREIFEKAHDAIWIQNRAGQIISANQATAHLTGYSLQELSKMNISRLLEPGGIIKAQEVEQILLRGIDVQKPYEQEIIKRDGRKGILMLTTSLLGDESEPFFLKIARDITEEKKMQADLRLYAGRIHTAYENERKRIARELHDDTIQILVAISRNLDNYISSNVSSHTIVLAPLEKINSNIDECLVRMRRFIQDLRPPTLEYLGLIPALRELTNEIRDQSDIDFHLAFNTTVFPFTREQQLLIYRIIQEGIRNIWKHSNAKKAEISIIAREHTINIDIKDNGKGFEIEDGSLFLEKGKLGLMGMKERSHLLGGHLNIISEPEKGTHIILILPV